jgi:NAD+ diphosphatase
MAVEEIPVVREHVHQRLTELTHDRAGLRRRDDDWLEEHWSDPGSRVLVVAVNRVHVEDGRLVWVRPEEAPDGVRLLLGLRDGCARFAVVVPFDKALHGSAQGWVSLRGLLPTLAEDPTDGSLVLHAIGVAEWLDATRFCPRCGGALSPVAEGHELRCSEGHLTFPRTDPAVIMLVTAGEPGADDERCLLGNHARWPEGRFSTLAGFCEPGESLEDAVRREVAEETGVTVGRVDYFGNQPWPLPASLMLGFFGRVEATPDAMAIECDPEELREARWFTRQELREGAESGALVLPSGVSISRSLIEEWYGGSLPGAW